MTQVLVLSAKERRNERLWRILNIGNMFKPTMGSKIQRIINLRIKITKKIVVLLISICVHGKKMHHLVRLQI